ncbi:MAG: hypothetical protein GX620_16235 [Chloroflexi bacterium]|nr:hypothetical protein [Chloroflexota bacterium]
MHQYTQEQEILRESIVEFVRDEVLPAVPQMEEGNEFPLALMRRCGDLGLGGLLFPEQYGGTDMGLSTFVMALEELARGSQTLALTLDASLTLCFLPILHAGTEEQKAKYLPGAVTMESIGAMAVGEATGTMNFAAHSGTAVRDGDEWVINATKVMTTNSQAADVYLVFAHVDGNPAPTAFLVEKDNPGLSFGELERKLGWHGSNTGTTIYENCRVSDADRLGEIHGGFEAVLVPIFHSCVGIGAMCNGNAAAALDQALEYTKVRNIGGKNLIEYQTVAQDIARAAMEIEVSRALVEKTAKLIDEGGVPLPGSALAVLTSACKVYPPELGSRVCDLAIQLHGGVGYLTNDIHRRWRDNRACLIGEGPTALHMDWISAAVASGGYRL